MATAACRSIEDPFITMLVFKTFMIGWRLVRLMILNDNKGTRRLQPPQSVLSRIMKAIGVDTEGTIDHEGNSRFPIKYYETQYLQWAETTFEARKDWHLGGWMTAVLKEALEA